MTIVALVLPTPDRYIVGELVGEFGQHVRIANAAHMQLKYDNTTNEFMVMLDPIVPVKELYLDVGHYLGIGEVYPEFKQRYFAWRNAVQKSPDSAVEEGVQHSDD